MGTWFYLSVVDWMEARKRRGLNRPYDWISLAYVTREKFDVSPDDRVIF